MVSLEWFSLTTLNLVIGFITLVGAIIGFVVSLWYGGSGGEGDDGRAISGA